MDVRTFPPGDYFEGRSMLPIHSLLKRILWDEEFGRGVFEVGYLDHVARRIIRVPFRRIHFEEGNHFSFDLEDEEGQLLNIPYHRVREVWRDGEVIWRRPG